MHHDSDTRPANEMTGDAHHALLARFYTAFQQRDGAAMAACYHREATFRDPAFELAGAEVGAMWRMLCARGSDLRVEYSNLEAGQESGSADWQAWYTFSATGLAVHNIVHSRFRFADGLIHDQVDTFSFWRWSRQALGPVGAMLGWTPLLRNRIRAGARRSLERFIEDERRPA